MRLVRHGRQRVVRADSRRAVGRDRAERSSCGHSCLRPLQLARDGELRRRNVRRVARGASHHQQDDAQHQDARLSRGHLHGLPLLRNALRGSRDEQWRSERQRGRQGGRRGRRLEVFERGCVPVRLRTDIHRFFLRQVQGGEKGRRLRSQPAHNQQGLDTGQGGNAGLSSKAVYRVRQENGHREVRSRASRLRQDRQHNKGSNADRDGQGRGVQDLRQLRQAHIHTRTGRLLSRSRQERARCAQQHTRAQRLQCVGRHDRRPRRACGRQCVARVQDTYRRGRLRQVFQVGNGICDNKSVRQRGRQALRRHERSNVGRQVPLAQRLAGHVPVGGQDNDQQYDNSRHAVRRQRRSARQTQRRFADL